VRDEYAHQYRELYDRHWWWRAREIILCSLLRKRFGVAAGLNILDVGCGDGLFFPKLEQFGQVRGVEPNADLISSKEREGGRMHVGYYDESFKSAEPFDLILMLDIIEHLPDESAILRKAYSDLSSGGVLLVTVPAFNCLWTRHDDRNEHCRRYTRKGLIHVLEKTGFVIEQCNYLFLWVALAKLLVHLKELVLPPAGERTYIPCDAINTLLASITVWEYRLVHRLNIPFGSSVFAMARRC
jgi:SAM-dependent methyltransferase